MLWSRAFPGKLREALRPLLALLTTNHNRCELHLVSLECLATALKPNSINAEHA